MAPTASSDERVGPHPSYIEVAKPYILHSTITKSLSELHMTEGKEDAVRLQGVAWIDSVRRSLQLPIRTFNTAVVYYHKFRLLHADGEYNWADASGAALFTACKIEDTLKKSREILCANWNLKLAPSEHLAPDDARFEQHSKLIIGLERLMLESAGFDFRNRHPQKLVVKIARAVGLRREGEAKTAWNASIDLYRTFAPLKQTTTTMAVACVELAARLHGLGVEGFVDRGVVSYEKWNTSRAEVMGMLTRMFWDGVALIGTAETLLDLLDLYTHHRTSTSIGPLYSLETFIDIRIRLNQEASAAKIPRYALYASEATTKGTNGTTPKPRNGVDPTSPLTPATPGGISPSTGAPTSATGIRGQNGTVRFMLDAARANHERAEVDKYYKVEEEEYEVEVPASADREERRGQQPSFQRVR